MANKGKGLAVARQAQVPEARSRDTRYAVLLGQKGSLTGIAHSLEAIVVDGAGQWKGKRSPGSVTRASVQRR